MDKSHIELKQNSDQKLRFELNSEKSKTLYPTLFSHSKHHYQLGFHLEPVAKMQTIISFKSMNGVSLHSRQFPTLISTWSDTLA